MNPAIAALAALLEVACHARGCRSMHADRRRADADEFGFGPCDCGLESAITQAGAVLVEAGALTPELAALIERRGR